MSLSMHSAVISAHSRMRSELMWCNVRPTDVQRSVLEMSGNGLQHFLLFPSVHSHSHDVPDQYHDKCIQLANNREQKYVENYNK